jgi:CRP-like cAMP-binding protein
VIIHRWCSALTMKPNKLKKNGKNGKFDPQQFLDTVSVVRNVVDFLRGESIFSQGEAVASVMYIQTDGVRFSVVNGTGKEAVVAMFGSGA